MHRWMPLALGFVQAVAAGEDEVGLRDQPLLERKQFGRRTLEVGEFVHAIIDDAVGRDMLRKRQHHRGIIPPKHGFRGAPAHDFTEKDSQRRGLLDQVEPGREVRRQHDHAALLAGGDVDARRGRVVDRLLPEQHVPFASEAAHQMLGTLEDEVPSKMTEAEQRASDALGNGVEENRSVAALLDHLGTLLV